MPVASGCGICWNGAVRRGLHPTKVPVDVHAAVLRLPPAQRAAAVLFYFEDRPVSEIDGWPSS